MYNNYGGYYNPYMPYPQQNLQPIQQAPPQPQPMQAVVPMNNGNGSSNGGIPISGANISVNNVNQDERIWVQGKGAAEAYLVSPNGFVCLWDTDGKTFYEKRADASGRPTMEIFSYTNTTVEPEEPKNDFSNADKENIDKEIKALKKRLEALENKGKKVKEDVE